MPGTVIPTQSLFFSFFLRTEPAHSTRTKRTDPVFFLFFSKSPEHTHTPQTPTRTELAHNTRTKRTDPVYGSVSLSRYRRPLRCRALDCPGSAAGVERQAEHARILTADDSRDVALVAEPVIDLFCGLFYSFTSENHGLRFVIFGAAGVSPCRCEPLRVGVGCFVGVNLSLLPARAEGGTKLTTRTRVGRRSATWAILYI